MKKITAKYPSNIALIKYWGKYGIQLPMNPSISLTLSEAYTETSIELFEKKSKEIEFNYFFEGKSNSKFSDRVINYIKNQEEFRPLLDNYSLKIESKNSFPHSAGIASSASAFASIAALLLKALSNEKIPDFNKKASHFARLGSGSACRSFQGPYMLWGKLDDVSESSNEYAIQVNEVHPNFQKMQDAILIVEDEPKKVSSSVGHSLMNNHPYASARFKDANKHCIEMLSTLKSGDFDSFISITEREALSLHSMMMTSEDYYMLMKPGTVSIIEKIFAFRNDTKLPICFTLDAGPNVHLLYPEIIKDKVEKFINEIKDQYKFVIFDKAGKGGEVFEK